MDRFTLEGVRYYQQGRKCGKPNCKCAQGELHGPYWYARDFATGTVTYIGAELPAEITRARETHARRKRQIYAAYSKLIRQAEALRRLWIYAAPHEGDADLIRELGFGSCLVRGPVRQVAQD